MDQALTIVWGPGSSEEGGTWVAKCQGGWIWLAALLGLCAEGSFLSRQG